MTTSITKLYQVALSNITKLYQVVHININLSYINVNNNTFTLAHLW